MSLHRKFSPRENGKDATASLFKELRQEFEGEAQFGRGGIFGFAGVKETVLRTMHIRTAMFIYQVITPPRAIARRTCVEIIHSSPTLMQMAIHDNLPALCVLRIP
jgi:hypothetical protein